MSSFTSATLRQADRLWQDSGDTAQQVTSWNVFILVLDHHSPLKLHPQWDVSNIVFMPLMAAKPLEAYAERNNLDQVQTKAHSSLRHHCLSMWQFNVTYARHISWAN